LFIPATQVASLIPGDKQGTRFAGPYMALDSDGHLIVENPPKGAPCKLLKTERWISIPSEAEQRGCANGRW
jgi:hypothetical protein